MNKPYQRDAIEQRQDHEGAKREFKQAESDRQHDDAEHQPERGGDEEE